MNTTEGNKLIAEFMGGELTNYPEKGMFPGEKGYQFPNPVYSYRASPAWWNVNALSYHTSWDWLMPVVEKIEGMEYQTRIVSTEYTEYPGDTKNTNIVAISNSMDVDFAYVKNDIPKIQAVWECVIKFIQWYNSNLPIGG